MGAQVDGAVARLEAEGVRVFFPPATFDMINVRAALVRDPELEHDRCLQRREKRT